MLKRFHILIAGACLLCAGPARPQTTAGDAHPASPQRVASIRLRFSNTDFSEVIQALALQTRASIVFPADMKKPISVDIAASTTDQALSLITAASGMAYRQVGRTYVVAPPVELRQALEPFGEKARLTLSSLTPADASKMLEGALPYLTVRPVGDQILAIGSAQDIAQARTLLAEQDKPRTEDPITKRVITLQYVQAAQVAKVLTAMYPDLKAEAVGASDKPGGAVGISGPRSETDGAKEAIQTLDVPQTPRAPDRIYRVYSIKYSSAALLHEFLDKAGLDIVTLTGPESYSPPVPGFHPLTDATLGTSSGGSGGTSGGSSSGMSSGGFGSGSGAEQYKPGDGTHSKFLVINGTPAELDKAFALLAQVDIPPQQVMIEVKVVDTSPQQAEQLGLTWNWQPFTFDEAPNGTAASTFNQNVRPLGFGAISRVPWSFQSVISALATRQEAKILADPRIQVVDNDDANIFIGDTIRTQVSQASISGTTIQVLEFPVGIILLVRPRINGDGKITMRVHPVVSTITSIDANGIPQTSSREAETTVMLQDGETVVIGGLIRDEVTKTVQEVPLLSKLPLVGELFRQHSTNHIHSDILVFITPHIVK